MLFKIKNHISKTIFMLKLANRKIFSQKQDLNFLSIISKEAIIFE